jgi:hypothetical protein
MQVPDRFYEKFKNADLKLRYGGPQKEDVGHTRAALAMCENIDWNVGRVLRGLEQHKLSENTIVLYFSDNGPNGWRWNGGMKGRKGSTDEGGVRAPLLLRWPGKVKAGSRLTQIAGAIDLLPTLTELTGVKRAGEKPLDGVSLAPQLLGKEEGPPDRMLFNHWNGKVSVRTQRYRLDAEGGLFDLAADPGQRKDIADENAELAKQLTAAVAAWKKDVLAELAGKDRRPFLVGHREFPRSVLPARDGVPHGNIRRSARAPNCSYFTNWTSRDDRITWDIEATADGRYEAQVLYTCARADVGSTIKLSFGENHVSAKVTEPHDPPSRGAEHDRVPRAGESYVKDFKPLRLGVLELKRGRGVLMLEATDIPSKQAIEVRSVVLTLQP